MFDISLPQPRGSYFFFSLDCTSTSANLFHRAQTHKRTILPILSPIHRRALALIFAQYEFYPVVCFLIVEISCRYC